MGITIPIIIFCSIILFYIFLFKFIGDYEEGLLDCTLTNGNKELISKKKLEKLNKKSNNPIVNCIPASK